MVEQLADRTVRKRPGMETMHALKILLVAKNIFRSL